MSNNHIKRILVDYIDLEKNPIDDIYTYYDEDNIMVLYALIIGPKNTPYENGFYFFKIQYTEEYPSKPPKCIFHTIDRKIRFNPNLYENGKICLSILGTWSGPSWKPVMDTKSILLNFQTLLHENPIINEPMYNNLNVEDTRSKNYNLILTYHNFRFAILEMYKKKNHYPFFNNIVEEIFKKNFDETIKKIDNYSEKYEGLFIEVYPWKNSNTQLNFKLLKEKFLENKI